MRNLKINEINTGRIIMLHNLFTRLFRENIKFSSAGETELFISLSQFIQSLYSPALTD